MTTMNMVQAINQTLDMKMSADDSIVLLGEDIGVDGGVFRVTEGLQKKYGAERVVDTPLVELGIVGTAIGMAINGLRPVPEIQFQDFIYTAFDQIINQMAAMFSAAWKSGVDDDPSPKLATTILFSFLYLMA